MSFINPDIYFISYGFRIRWTLIAFIFIIVILFAYLLLKRLKKTSLSLSSNVRKLLPPTLIYLSIIPIYFFRDVIGNCGKSAIYTISERLNRIESLVATVLILTLIYGFLYKNSHVFINLYFRVLAAVEFTYIISYCITKQVNLEQWHDWLIGFLLWAAFTVLSIIKTQSPKKEFLKKKSSKEESLKDIKNRNIHDPVDRYDLLFSSRKNQAKELINIIKNDISKWGYSVCVTGEWGAGKTSLINGAINEVKKNKDIKFYEIRINALELDDSESLIKYFFLKIEQILKKNNIYVGIASEYRELIASISGTIISESITNFVSKKLNKVNADYRKNIERLSQLLHENLEDSRILIIVDDIERCSNEKAKSYLFLMKEIATMNQCITLFLADINKLKETSELDDTFFEKFFNYTISLSPIGVDEMILNIKIEASDLGSEIEKMLKKFDIEIEKQEKTPYFTSNNDEERKKREDKISSIKARKTDFSYDLTNPRHMNKALEYYKKLNQQIARYKEQEPVNSFLDKVNYKRQLSLISIIYGLYNGEFILLKSDIYNYINNVVNQHKSNESQKEKIHSLIKNEWCEPREYDGGYIINEKLRFVKCMLTDINELVNISNGYTSLEEEQISSVKQGIWPRNTSFPDLIATIYRATYDKLSERAELIKKVFDLYAKDISRGVVDDCFELFSHNVATGSFSNETPVIQMFVDTFCKNNCYLDKPDRIRKEFISFAEKYLRRNLTNFSRYFLPVSLTEDITWDRASEKVFLRNNCEDMLKSYCEICESHLKSLNFPNNTPDVDAISRLKNIIDRVNEEYIKLEMAECKDVLQISKQVSELMEEIRHIFKIEQFIDKCSKKAEQNSFDINKLSQDTLSDDIEKLYNDLSGNIDYNRNTYIQRLLGFVCHKKVHITNNDYDKLNCIVEKFSENNSLTSSYRQMLIYIKKNNLCTPNTTADTVLK